MNITIKKLVFPEIIILIFGMILYFVEFNMNAPQITLFALVSLLLILLPGYCLLCVILTDTWRRLELPEIIALSLLFSILFLVFLYVTLIVFNSFNRSSAVVFYTVFSMFSLFLGFWRSRSSEEDEDKNHFFPKFRKSNVLIFFSLFIVAFLSRFYYIMKAYPLFVGWDTSRYIHESIWFMQGIPQRFSGGLIFSQYPIVRILGAEILLLFGFLHSIPIFIAILDSLSIFGLYLLFKKVSGDSRARATRIG